MKHALISYLGCVLLTGLLTVAGHPVAADGREHTWEDDGHAYDHAHRAVVRGDILPVATILQHLQRQLPGEIIDMEFEYEDGIPVYEFKVIDQRGRLIEVYVNAQTGDLLEMEEE